MDDELNELYQQVILDHSRKPRHFHVLPEANRMAEGNNPLCGDRYTVYLKLEGEVIRDISFQGSGCAISKASASMMSDELKGKTIADARLYFSQYQKMVTTGKMDEEAMGKLCAFAGVHHFPMRVKCAILPWHAMLAGLDGQTSVSTDVH
jgi:nitrogen fixation protein NifU and related proteins